MTTGRDGKLRLGVTLTGGGSGGAGGWRDPRVRADGASNLSSFRELAEIAEAGKFDFGFIADSAYITESSTPMFLSRLEPLTALSALAGVTSRLGLVGTFSTSYSEPFTTARQLASLDKLSGGRAAWNAVTSALEGVARNHGHDRLHDHALRYRIAAEYVQVVKGLWDSWEDDAFVRDKASGTYVDFDKMHTLHHKGEFFSVQGPLNMERSPQGRPVIFQAGASDAGRDLAAREADAIFSDFTSGADVERARAFYDDVKRRAESHGRSRDDILIFPKISPWIGATPEEAEAAYQTALGYLDIDTAVKYLGRYFSFFDFARFPLDEVLPDLGDVGSDSFRSTADDFKRIAREERLTLRQLALRASLPRGDFVGTPAQIADRIEAMFDAGVVDGFIIGATATQLRRFVDHVVPALRQRGLFRTEYESSTLRGNLGLPFPAHRHARRRDELVAH